MSSKAVNVTTQNTKLYYKNSKRPSLQRPQPFTIISVQSFQYISETDDTAVLLYMFFAVHCPRGWYGRIDVQYAAERAHRLLP